MQNPVPLENGGCQSISFLTENFTRKSFQELPIEEQKIPSDKIYSRENGFQQAGCAWGNPDILQTCLNLILRDYRGEEDSRRNSYKALVEALKRESISLESQKKDFEKQLVDLDANSEIVAKKSRISELKEEIRELQANPKKILPDEDVSNKATFFVSLILISALTLYLFVFYSSAGDSAFFKNLATDLQIAQSSGNLSRVFNSIFDPNALPEAMKKGNLFVLAFPVIFLSLGFLIHKIFEQKNWILLGIILSVTFFFDSLIAYQIGSKLYYAQVLTGLATGTWNLGMAVKDVNFWSVILAGFVVYLVWSFIWGLCMREYLNSKPAKLSILKRREEIKEFESEISQSKATIGQRISAITIKINENNITIDKYESMIKTRILMWDELERRLDTFMLGWLAYLAQWVQSPEKVQEKVKEAIVVANEFKTGLRRDFNEGQERRF